MTIHKSIIVFCILLPTAAADDIGREPLKNNPFIRPSGVDVAAGQGSGSGTHGIDLRATLASMQNGLANVGGTIVTVGEEIGGYRLDWVGEGEAIFSKNDVRVRVKVNGER